MENIKNFLPDEDILANLDGNLSDLDLPGMSSDDEDGDKTFVPPAHTAGQSESEDISSDEDSPLPPDPGLEPDPGAESDPAPVLSRKPINKQRTRRMLWRNEAFNEKPWPGPLDLETIENPDPVRTPLSYSTYYFPDEFFKLASNFTNIYSLSNGKQLNTNPQELKRFFDFILDSIINVGAGTEITNDYGVGMSESVVTTLLKDFLGKGHSVYLDNWLRLQKKILQLENEVSSLEAQLKEKESMMEVILNEEQISALKCTPNKWSNNRFS
ncbi:uncharacterized protein LOC120352699 [Nilaparvata lugens]|uniref:uncharacterized protein LOC120352699 n=1 Tax=Nilaparvata lugens TaxID=108931 RepID=UPI00193CBF37|nr:uncharacterized protein LOC120352699 [Nilaparvata lugens]